MDKYNTQAVQAIPHLTLHAAQTASNAAIAKATQMRVPENIAIVDTSARLLHFQRMPGAKYASIDVAINKAFTSAAFGLPTHQCAEQAQPGMPLFGINDSNECKFMIIGGGLPIDIDGQLVGAIGCSTGTPEEDRLVAEAGVNAVMELVEATGPQKAAQQIAGKKRS